MANPLSADTLAKIQETVAQISVAHDLDPEIQSELRSHLEEKLLAYLAGEEKLSEADALLLTRAHFGDPATIKSLFRRTHAGAHHLSLARRLVAAFIATFSVTYVTSNLLGLVGYFLAGPISTAAWGPHGRIVLSLMWAADFLASGTVTILVLWKLFARWRRGMAQGRRLWFQTWPFYVLLPLLLVVWFVTRFPITIWLRDPSLPNPDFDLIRVIGYVLAFVFSAFTVLLWLWWCDQAPYSRRALIYTAAAWFGYFAVSTAFTITSSLHLYQQHGDFLRAFILHYGVVLPLMDLLPRFLPTLLILAAYLRYRRPPSPSVSTTVSL